MSHVSYLNTRLHETQPKGSQTGQRARTMQGAAGRGIAVAPWQIPWKGWKDILISNVPAVR